MTLFGKTVLSEKIVSNLPGFFFSSAFFFYIYGTSYFT